MAVVLAGAVAAAAAPTFAAPAAAEDDASYTAWIGAWLTRLVPSWVAIAGDGEDAPPPPSSDDLTFDDSADGKKCDPTNPSTCTGGEGWPDRDPDG